MQYTKLFTQPLAKVIIFDYHKSIATSKGGAVKRSEFVRWLAQQGATFKEGGSHTKVYLNGKQTTIPRHTELKKGTVEGIKKQLNLK
ncbi:type II toxin-antitoxin system HicA family toxin [Cupriavidus basilensis]